MTDESKIKLSKEDYKRIRAKIKVKLRAYKINPDKAESYLERFKGLDITSIGEERVESLIRGEVEKSEDPSMLFELGVLSEKKFDWRRKGAILDAMIILSEEIKKININVGEIISKDFVKFGLARMLRDHKVYELLRMIKPDLKPWQLTRVPEGYWDDPEHVKEAVKWLVDEMAKEGKPVKDITAQDFESMGLTRLVHKYNLYNLLKLVKPDLKPWQLTQVSPGYWDNPKHIEDAVKWLVEKKAKEGKKIVEINSLDFADEGLSKISDKYGVYTLLKMVKPDLKPWDLGQVPQNYWDDPKNVKEAVEWLVEEMAKEGKKIEEISQDDFRDAGLTRLTIKYTIYELLKMVKPNLNYWELNRLPDGFWNNPKNVKEAVEWLVEKMKKEGKKIEEISQQDVIDNGLSGLLKSYTLYELLKMVKPDLKPWQLSRVPEGYWDDPEHVKEAVEWLVEEKAKEGKRIEEITQKDFLGAGLRTLFLKGSVYELLKMVKPDLKPWQLTRVPEGYWDDPKNIKEAVGWLVKEMAKEGKEIEDIISQDFKDAGLSRLLDKYKKAELLRMVKPDYRGE